MSNSPGPFGWVSNLVRWSGSDVRVDTQQGPLPPQRGRVEDPTDRDLYSGLIDGWMSSTVGASLSSFFSEPRSRKELYLLFERMDMTDMAGSVLDVYAEEATTIDNDKERAVWFETQNPAIMAALETMAERLKLEDEITSLTREVCKFGDSFNRLVYQSGLDGGVRRLLPCPPLGVSRDEDKEGRLRGYKQEGKKFRNDHNTTSYPWDFVHFRLPARDRRYPYGTSVLHNGMRPWKEWLVLSDWALGYQLGKHADRNLILLDVGTQSEVEKSDIARRVSQKLKKNLILDPSGTTGRNAQTQANPWTPLEDIVMAVSGDENKTQVHKLPGSGNALDIAPLKMLEARFYAACRCPQSFFGYGDQQAQPLNPKASLNNQDIRYARNVKRIQKSMLAGLRYISELNLMLMMSPGDRDQLTEAAVKDVRQQLDYRLDGNQFEVRMAKSSFLDELERLEVMTTRQQVALAMMELSNGNPIVDQYEYTAYIFREIVGMPEEEVQRVLRADLENQHLDNMNAGLLPDGTAPGAKTESQQREARRRIADVGDLSKEKKVLLSEAIAKNEKLRDLIYKGQGIFTEAGPKAPYTGVLPACELTEKGFLKDSLTEDDVAGIIAEAYAQSRHPSDDE